MATTTKAQPQTTREGHATTAEVAAYTGFAVGTLRNWRWQKRGPHFTGRGSNVRYAWADVDRWMAERD